MASSNIDRFDEYAGLIFARLYATFPMRVQLDDDEVIPGAWRDGEFQLEAYESEAEFVKATIHWLKDAGYIDGRPSNRGLFDAVLTSKGLEVLKATPASLDNGPSLGERITDAAKEEGRETMRSLVSEVLGIGARLISPMFGLSS
ncbi:hypothetical protein QZH44_06880 [Pseudomonas corrugata]|uniref:hypothetical protein n=1 Tax=Pseudomonas corrugata TaxID=47879 RepID=UPI003D814090